MRKCTNQEHLTGSLYLAITIIARRAVGFVEGNFKTFVIPFPSSSTAVVPMGHGGHSTHRHTRVYVHERNYYSRSGRDQREMRERRKTEE